MNLPFEKRYSNVEIVIFSTKYINFKETNVSCIWFHVKLFVGKDNTFFKSFKTRGKYILQTDVPKYPSAFL